MYVRTKQHALLARTSPLALALTTRGPSNLRRSLFLTFLARVGHGTKRDTAEKTIEHARARERERERGEEQWNGGRGEEEEEEERRSRVNYRRAAAVPFASTDNRSAINHPAYFRL